MTRQPA